jgi:hypothetical protein
VFCGSKAPESKKTIQALKRTIKMKEGQDDSSLGSFLNGHMEKVGIKREFSYSSSSNFPESSEFQTQSTSLKGVIQRNLCKKYLTSRDYYNVKIINDVIYNENTNIVSLFKDYLIYDDVSEFLKRQYTFAEGESRLPRIFEFYEKYSKVFPNYVILPESKYMFKNIERKQRQIDEKHRHFMEIEEGGEQSDEDHMFHSGFFDSVAKIVPHSQIQESKIEAMFANSSLCEAANKLANGPPALPLGQLLKL